MDRSARIYVAGHRGMVGSAIVRRLEADGYTSLLRRTHAELDLTRQDAVEKFFAAERPEYVFDAAAKGGRDPGQFVVRRRILSASTWPSRRT
jgi:GDP-L-fucose synthase